MDHTRDAFADALSSGDTERVNRAIDEIENTELEERATAWGFDSRHDLQVIRLALRDAAVTGRPAGTRSAAALVDRYNLVQSPDRVRELLGSISTDAALRDRFLDERLVAGIKTDC